MSAFCASYWCKPAQKMCWKILFRISKKNDVYLEILYYIEGMLLCKNIMKKNNERERQRGSDRAFQHFGLSFYQKCWNDLDRTRTCNPQIRSLVPYPLGHKVLRWKLLGTKNKNPVKVATRGAFCTFGHSILQHSIPRCILFELPFHYILLTNITFPQITTIWYSL